MEITFKTSSQALARFHSLNLLFCLGLNTIIFLKFHSFYLDLGLCLISLAIFYTFFKRIVNLKKTTIVNYQAKTITVKEQKIKLSFNKNCGLQTLISGSYLFCDLKIGLLKNTEVGTPFTELTYEITTNRLHRLLHASQLTINFINDYDQTFPLKLSYISNYDASFKKVKKFLEEQKNKPVLERQPPKQHITEDHSKYMPKPAA